MTPQDRAATHAYLAAVNEYDAARLANETTVAAGVEALTNRIAGECPRVLAGAPGPSASSPSAYREGGAFRTQGRLSRLRDELGFALRQPYRDAGRQATLAFTSKVKALHWRDRILESAAHAFANELDALLAIPTPNVCADLRAWAAGGFAALPAGTREFFRAQETAEQSGIAVLTLYQRLLRYEGPSEKTLIRKTRQLRLQHPDLARVLESAAEKVEHALAFPAEEQPRIGPPPGSILLERGKAALGASFKAWLEPKGSRGNEGCALPLAIEGGGLGGLGTCMSRSGRAQSQSVNCAAGVLTVTANTLPAARLGRLKLSDGREITSRLVYVPRRLGGPASFYYQALRGPSPIPVSLAELDSHGRLLHVLRLTRVVECTKHPVKILPGGLRTIVRDRVAGGPRFRIIGEHFRFLGKVEFSLKIELENGAGGGGGGGPGRLFDWSAETGCRPHPYLIVYGLLRQSRDVVLVRAAGKLVELRHVPIPASLHASGVVAYAVLSEEPTELLIEAPSHRIVQKDKLGAPFPNRCNSEEGEEGSGTSIVFPVGR